MISLPTHKHVSLNLSQAVNVFGGHLMQALEESTILPSKSEIELSMDRQLLFVNLTLRLLESVDFRRKELYSCT